MPMVVSRSVTMSLDGFIAGPDDWMGPIARLR
jgi:hypothetical protein